MGPTLPRVVGARTGQIFAALLVSLLAAALWATPARAVTTVTLVAGADLGRSAVAPPATWDVRIDGDPPTLANLFPAPVPQTRRLVLTTGPGLASSLETFASCPREILRDEGPDHCPAGSLLGSGQIDFQFTAPSGAMFFGTTTDLRLVRTGSHTLAAYAGTPAGPVLVPAKLTEGATGVTLTFDMGPALRLGALRRIRFTFDAVGRGVVFGGGPSAGPGDHHAPCRRLGGRARDRCLAAARERAYRVIPRLAGHGGARSRPRLLRAVSCTRGPWTFGADLRLTSGEPGVATSSVPCTPPVTAAAARAARTARAAAVRAARARAAAPPVVPIGQLSTGAPAYLVRTGAGGWGVRVSRAGAASVFQARPVLVEATPSVDSPVDAFAVPYSAVRPLRGGGAVGTARVRITSYLALVVRDEWRVRAATLRVSRRVQVDGAGAGGFATAVRVRLDRHLRRNRTDEFLPGQIYRGTGGIVRGAIGGRNTFPPLGRGVARIREDRLPAPLWAFRLPDATSLTAFDPAPRGGTTAADNADRRIRPLIDRRFAFGSFEAVQPADRLDVGFWYPGSEGPSTYTDGGFAPLLVPGFRRRYNPLSDGVVQRYTTAFRFGRGEGHFGFQRAAWRTAWAALKPRVHPVDLAQERRSLVSMVMDRVATTNGRTGISTFWNAVLGVPATPSGTGRILMGFIGKNVELAHLLLLDSVKHPGPQAARERQLAGQILDSFTLLPMSPPLSEGFELGDGRPAFYPRGGVVHVRALTDGVTMALRAGVLAKRAHLTGITTPDTPAVVGARLGRPPQGPDGWIAWARELGEFFLRHQNPDGTFPRSFRAGTEEVSDPSPVTSDQPVELLLELTQATGDPRYAAAARRAGEAHWRLAVRMGSFAGSTSDAPGTYGPVVDKESGSIALSSYLALYRATRERKWLDRAQTAASFLESWIWAWNVPMPAGVAAQDLAWKPGVPTVGVQSITTGNAYVDEYSATDVASFTSLYRYTHDQHWFDVARILLHDTKAMLARPGRIFDLAGPGWQQEAWTMGTPRGSGNQRSWLPWITAVQLDGILVTEEREPALFRRLAARK